MAPKNNRVGLLDYARNRHPRQRLHLSVQGSATSYEAINFFHQQFGVKRAVLPRVLSLATARQEGDQSVPAELVNYDAKSAAGKRQRGQAPPSPVA